MQTQERLAQMSSEIIAHATKDVKTFIEQLANNLRKTECAKEAGELEMTAGNALNRLKKGETIEERRGSLEPLRTLDTWLRSMALKTAAHWFIIIVEQFIGTGHVGVDFEHEGVKYVFHDFRWRKLHLVTGPVAVKAAYYRRSGGGKGIFPLDLVLGVDEPGYTREAAFMMSHFASETDYPQAEELIERATGLTIDQNRLHRHVESLGHSARELLSNPSKSVECRGEDDVMVIETDGLMTPMRFDPDGDDPAKAGAGWHEAHVGVVGIPGKVEKREPKYRRRDRSPNHKKKKRKTKADDYEDVKLFDQTYVATYEGRDGHLERLKIEAERRGWTPNILTAVIGDGADWVHGKTKLLFPGAVHILDWYHAMEHLGTVRDLAYESGAPSGAAWYARHEANLWEGNVTAVIRSIRYLARTSSVKYAEKLIGEAKFFKKRIDIMDYPLYRSMGLPIGSGAVESACRHVVQERCKCSGMRWSPEGLRNLLGVKTAIINRRFDDLWRTHTRRAERKTAA